jgi:hypothetical protein
MLALPLLLLAHLEPLVGLIPAATDADADAATVVYADDAYVEVFGFAQGADPPERFVPLRTAATARAEQGARQALFFALIDRGLAVDDAYGVAASAAIVDTLYVRDRDGAGVVVGAMLPPRLR